MIAMLGMNDNWHSLSPRCWSCIKQRANLMRVDDIRLHVAKDRADLFYDRRLQPGRFRQRKDSSSSGFYIFGQCAAPLQADHRYVLPEPPPFAGQLDDHAL